MTDLAARPEVTGRRGAGANLLLVGYSDDEILDRPELAREWHCTVRTIRAYQHLTKDPLGYFNTGGRVRFRAGTARDWQRRREHHRNPSRRN